MTSDITHPNPIHLERARSIISQALLQMYRECEATGSPQIWRVFYHRVVKPILDKQEPQSYAELVREFGFCSPAQAHNMLISGKRAFSRILALLVERQALEAEGPNGEVRKMASLDDRPTAPRRLGRPPRR